MYSCHSVWQAWVGQTFIYDPCVLRVFSWAQWAQGGEAMVPMAPPPQAKGSPLAWAIPVLNYLLLLSNVRARVAPPLAHLYILRAILAQDLSDSS